jgi:GT2 family glycosyltransferase
MSQISVIVPVWNGRDLLQKLLDSLRRQTYPIAEVIAIDNGSRDGAAELAEGARARVIRMGFNSGFSRAVNRGIAACLTEWLAIVNTDVELAPDWLEKLMHAAQDPGIWFATGKILSSTDPGTIDGTYDALCRGACPWRIGSGRPDGPHFSRPASIHFASGTASLFRAALFEHVGQFEESFDSYLEDVDLGIRCALQGYAGVYVPEAVSYHRGSGSAGKWHPDTVRMISRNQLLLAARHYPRRLLLRYCWPILVAQTLWGLVALRHGAGWAFLRGKFEGVRRWAAPHFSRVPEKSDRIRAVLESGEQQIRDCQRKTGFDLYWRLYFLLTRGEAN